jgi:hypothetical protein
MCRKSLIEILVSVMDNMEILLGITLSITLFMVLLFQEIQFIPLLVILYVVLVTLFGICTRVALMSLG